MILSTDLGHVVGSDRQQMNHVHLEFPGIGFLLSHGLSPYAHFFSLLTVDHTIGVTCQFMWYGSLGGTPAGEIAAMFACP